MERLIYILLLLLAAFACASRAYYYFFTERDMLFSEYRNRIDKGIRIFERMLLFRRVAYASGTVFFILFALCLFFY